MEIRCRKCLISDISDSRLYESIKRTVESVKMSERCPEDIYKDRLNICRECDKLLNGMCRICGCFVEVRAARKKEQCPGIPAKWTKTD